MGCQKFVHCIDMLCTGCFILNGIVDSSLVMIYCHFLGSDIVAFCSIILKTFYGFREAGHTFLYRYCSHLCHPLSSLYPKSSQIEKKT